METTTKTLLKKAKVLNKFYCTYLLPKTDVKSRGVPRDEHIVLRWASCAAGRRAPLGAAGAPCCGVAGAASGGGECVLGGDDARCAGATGVPLGGACVQGKGMVR